MYRLVGFDGGYVGLDNNGIWWSAEGSHWERAPLAGVETLPPCPSGDSPQIWAASAVSNGPDLLLMGGKVATDGCLDPSSDEPVPIRGTGWLTTDGRTTIPVETPTDDFEWLYAWPTSVGWQALVARPAAQQRPRDARRALWQSADGITWTEAAPVMLERDLTDAKSAISADGTRLIIGATFALASTDGISWRELDVPYLGDENSEILHVAPPAIRNIDPPATTSWLVALSRLDLSSELIYRPEIWQSADLEAWTRTQFPDTGGTVDDLVRLYDDNYFVNSTPCKNFGDYCEPLAARQFISNDDGMTWEELPGSFGDNPYDFVANGPAGLLALRRQDLTAWRLTVGD